MFSLTSQRDEIFHFPFFICHWWICHSGYTLHPNSHTLRSYTLHPNSYTLSFRLEAGLNSHGLKRWGIENIAVKTLHVRLDERV